VTTDQPVDYFLEIEARFAERRGTPFIFSGKDYALLKEWETEGIPLAIVLEAIDSCFEKRVKSGRKGTISSLSYCRHAVKELWGERKEMQVGSGEAIPELDSSVQLESLATALKAAAAEVVEAAFAPLLMRGAEAVLALAGRHSVPEIEELLVKLEGQLVDELMAALPEPQRQDLLGRVDAELKGYSIPSEDVRRKTREANLRRAVRRLAAIPRLSLFG
jgi:hypothetical protein